MNDSGNAAHVLFASSHATFLRAFNASYGKQSRYSVQVPLGNGGQETLPLVALVMHEHAVHLARHRRFDHFIFAPSDQAPRPATSAVSYLLAFLPSPRKCCAARVPQDRACAECRRQKPSTSAAGHQVRIYHGVDRSILESARCRNPQPAGAVLVAPVGIHRRPETCVPQSTIRVHGGTANGREGGQVLHHAANAVQADRPRLLLPLATAGRCFHRPCGR